MKIAFIKFNLFWMSLYLTPVSELTCHMSACFNYLFFSFWFPSCEVLLCSVKFYYKTLMCVLQSYRNVRYPDKLSPSSIINSPTVFSGRDKRMPGRPPLSPRMERPRGQGPRPMPPQGDRLVQPSSCHCCRTGVFLTSSYQSQAVKMVIHLEVWKFWSQLFFWHIVLITSIYYVNSGRVFRAWSVSDHTAHTFFYKWGTCHKWKHTVGNNHFCTCHHADWLMHKFPVIITGALW